MMYGIQIDDVITYLRQDGIFTPAVPIMLPQQMVEFREALDKAPVYASHVSAKAQEPPMPLDQAFSEKRWPVFAPHMSAVIKAPHWLETAFGFFPLAKEYFEGDFPRLYSINAFWTMPADGPLYIDTQAWHRDGDDRRQFTIFMFGTSIPDPSEGAHLYQRGTHLVSDDKLGWPFREAPPLGTVEAVWGQAGTAMIVDTGGLHKAIRPASRARLLVWARYGVSNPPASYGWDQLSPVPKEEIGDRYPTDPELQEAIRLVVA